MNVLFFILGIISLGWSLYVLFRRIAHYNHIYRGFKQPNPGYHPKVGLIVPCRGIDHDFEQNIKSILKQDYDNYHVVFITGASDDHAYPVLEKILKGSQWALARLVTSGPARNCSQKIVSLLRGVDEIDDDTEVLAFADSDGWLHRSWLRNLVNPLWDSKVGATTSYRWYLPVKGSFWSAVRSVWNAASANPFYNGKYTFVWGGTAALRKAVFEEIGVADLWKNALSDDLVLSKAVKKAGYRIEFVPKCMVVSSDGCNFGQLVEWTTRQIVILRVYAPEVWKIAAYSYGFFNFAIVLGLILCLRSIGGESGLSLEGVLLLSNLPVRMMNGYFRFLTAKETMPHQRRRIQEHWWIYILLNPVSSILMSFNILKAATTNRVSWRGIRYEMRSPSKTIVLHQ